MARAYRTVIEQNADAFTESFSLKIRAAETNATPTDAAAFQINAQYQDSNAVQAEAVSLILPDYADANATPTDANLITLRVWLSGSAGPGVTNPGNADGQANGTNAVIQTAPLNPNTEAMTSQVGANLPAGVNVTSAIYRGWFSATVPLVTSTVSIIADYSGGSVTMLSTTASVSHAGGTFTFDLVAAGINTIAELQSMTVRHVTNDLAAGVSPATLNVDAGAIELVGAFV